MSRTELHYGRFQVVAKGINEMKQYAKENGLEKQRMIYNVMKHIVNQTIPECVINSEEYQWNPTQNKVYKDGKENHITFR